MDFQQQLDELRARIERLESPPRLGPRPETEDEKEKREATVNRLVADLKTQLQHEHEQDHDGRQICTTSGEAPSKVRAEQTEPTGQHKSYIVLCEEERAKGFVRPYRDAYKHQTCGTVTTMGRALSETYARDPKFYDSTFCVRCNRHLPVSQFVWTADGQEVGS